MNFKNVKADNPTLWTCSHCLHTVLSFLNHSLNSSASSKDPTHLIDLTDEHSHLLTLNTNKNNLKILHINTQSLTSSFDEFLLQQTKYNFDIVAMSETWLKNNDLLIKHVTIPGYDMLYKNREKVRGRGVGFIYLIT